MLRVLVGLSSLGERRAATAADGVHRRPLVQQVLIHRVLERLTTRRTQTVLVSLQRQGEQPVNLRHCAKRGDAEGQGPGRPQLSEGAGGLRVAETLREKSGTATFDRIRSLASLTI
jgi:hypothetical protein